MSLEQTTLPVGALLYNRYLVKNILGAGQNGTVYLAKDQQAQTEEKQLVAIKEMLGLENRERQQFTSNSGLLQQLNHPALPRIHFIFNDETRERIYLIMDYIEGKDLETLRQEQSAGYFAWDDLQTFLAPVFDALTYLHGQTYPIFHGDIKPINLIQQNVTGNIFLVDLGYTQASIRGPRGQFTSTFLSNYRAPERFTGQIAAPTDVYELGATLHQLLAGQPPVDASVRSQETKRGEPDPLLLADELAPTIAHPFALILQQALALDPDKRFATIEAFHQALNAVPASAPTVTIVTRSRASAQPATRTDGQTDTTPTGKKHRRSPIFAIVLLLVLSVGAWALIQSHATGTSYHGDLPPVPTRQPTSFVNQSATPSPTGETGSYPALAGIYQGTLNPLDGTSQSFSMTIQQQQSRLNGTFTLTTRNSTFTGTTDTSGHLHFIVFNSSGNALYTFQGGLNGTTQFSDTLGGTFSSCAPGHGSVCQPGSGLAGTWTLTQATS